MKRLLLMVAFVLPLLVVAQTYYFNAYSVSTGSFNRSTEKFDMSKYQDMDTPILLDVTNSLMTIKVEDEISIKIYTSNLEKLEKYNELTMTGFDDTGKDCIMIIRIYHDTTKYNHVLTIRYPGMELLVIYKIVKV